MNPIWNSPIYCERVFKTSLGNCFLSILSSELWVTELLPVLEIDLFGVSQSTVSSWVKKSQIMKFMEVFEEFLGMGHEDMKSITAMATCRHLQLPKSSQVESGGGYTPVRRRGSR